MKSQKGIAHLFLILFLIVAVGVGIYLVTTRTNILPQASDIVAGPETSFSLDTEKKAVRVGEEFKVNVLVRSDIDAANLFSALISYPTDKLELTGIYPPLSNESTSSGTIRSGSIQKPSLILKILDKISSTVQAQSASSMPVISAKAYCSAGKPAVELNWKKVETSDLEYLFMKSPDGKGGVTVSTLYDRYQYPIKDTGFISLVNPGVAYTYYLESFSGQKSNSVTVTTPTNCANATPTPKPDAFCNAFCMNDNECATAKDGCTSCVNFQCQVPAKPSVTPTPIPPKPSVTPPPLPSPVATGVVNSPIPNPSVSPYFIKKWVEHTNDKTRGTLALSGAVPNPGFKTEKGQKGIMVTITFRAKANGEVNLDFIKDGTAIYRNSDNQNILSTTRGAKISIGGVVPTVSPNYPGKLYLKVDSDRVSPGCTLPVVIAFDTGGKRTVGVDAMLKYDPKIITVKSFDKGKNFADYPSKIDNNKGVAMVSGISGPPPTGKSFSGADILAKVHFQVNSNAPQGSKVEIAFDFDPNNPAKTTDSNMVEETTDNELLGSVSSSSFLVDGKIGSCPSDVIPGTPTPSPSIAPISRKRADLFDDPKKPNEINEQDFSVFFTKCAEKGIELFGQPASIQPICDINNDGKINTPDWAMMVSLKGQVVQ